MNKKILPKARITIIFLLIVLILSLFIKINTFIFLVAVAVINAIILSIDRYLSFTHDFEISTFSSILLTVKYNFTFGFFAIVLTKLGDFIYNKSPELGDLFSFICYVIGAILASILKNHLQLPFLGIVIVIIMNMYNYFVEKFILGLSDIENYFQILTNVMFNLILFLNFSGFLIRVI